MYIKRIVASEIAVLDSDVRTGGGTNVTAELQAALDEALVCGGVHLIMDGAALVSGLRIHSNTTIECLTRDCGFFLAPQSNCAIVSNSNWSRYECRTRNIILKGGTYNQDCLNQRHDLLPEECSEERRGFLLEDKSWVFGLEFYGVEHLEIRDLTMRNWRTFAVTIGGFRNVVIENVWLDLPDRMHAQNQDGFHFWGPGQFLTVRSVGGCVGDDFMNIGPDEVDFESSISDVLVDGCFLDDADQAIRLLTRSRGTLDRVTIRNISGTYRSFGFYINPWFPDVTYGNFRNIFIENVDLRQTEPNYDYRAPMLFNIGGNVETMTIQNVRHHHPLDNRALFEIGHPSHNLNSPLPADNLPLIENLVIDGLTIIEDGPAAADADYLQVYQPVERLELRNVTVIRKNTGAPDGHLLTVPGEQGEISRLVLRNVEANGFLKLIDYEEKIGTVLSVDVTDRR